MTISFVGAQANAGTTVTIPTHQSGDFILIFAFRDGSTTQPTVPAAGGTVPTWTPIATGGANQCSARLHYAVATASTTTSGTWTNATELVCMVYRGAKIPGAFLAGSGASTTISYPTLTLNRTDGSSWVVGVAGHRSATNVEVAPTGMTNRAFTGTEAAGHDTNGTVTSWSQQTVTVNANSGWRSWTVELRDGTVVLVANNGVYSVSGNNAGFTKASPKVLIADKGVLSVAGVNASIRHDADIIAETTTIAIAGVQANVLHSAAVKADTRFIAISGNTAALIYAPTTAKTLTAVTGIFLTTRGDAILRVARLLVASRYSASLSGSPANLLRLSRLYASTKAVYLLGANVSFVYVRPNEGKGLRYQSVISDPRKIMINTYNPEDQLAYYITKTFRIL